MAFSNSLRAAFAFLIITGLLIFVYQSPEPAVPATESEDIISSPITSSQQPCAALSQLQQIIRAMKVPTSQMFLADPFVLKSLQEQTKRDSNHKDGLIGCDNEKWNSGSGSVFFNMGMLHSFSSLEDVVQRICTPLSAMDVMCSRIESEWIPLLNRSAVTHLMIESSHLQLHVACFVKVLRNVFWVHQMNHIVSGALLGTNQSEVYDTILVHEAAVANAIVLPVPVDIHSFLFQMSTSRFVSCDQNAVHNMTSGSDENPEVQDNTRRSMIQMKRLMTQLQMPVFLMSGTLLGWFRECRAIPYTTDADFATWATFASQKLEGKIIHMSHSDGSFRVFDIFGKFDMGYEISFLLRNGFKSDLFFLYEETGDRVSSSGHVVWNQLYYKYFYPKFELCSTIFMTVRFNVPCDPEVILNAEYGDWRTPVHDSEYSYKTSPRNRGPAIKYPPNMHPLYREFP
jgi:hypothetical protein